MDQIYMPRLNTTLITRTSRRAARKTARDWFESETERTEETKLWWKKTKTKTERKDEGKRNKHRK